MRFPSRCSTTLHTLFIGATSLFLSCTHTAKKLKADILIVNGTVIDGSGSRSFQGDVAIKDSIIVYVGSRDSVEIEASVIIEARDLIVSPGFIDPHTHSLDDLKSLDSHSNVNYLTQGVTTVFNGNDGAGPYRVREVSEQLVQKGIGTNTAFFVGHGTVRREVLGGEAVAPDNSELLEMKTLVAQAMQEGAFGLSTGLYYAPGSFASTEEVIELTKVVEPYKGIYDSHIRDESTYSIGLIEAINEAIRIGEEAGVPVNLAHIKALGTDVWGKSGEIIAIVEEAQSRGVKVTADQYPWLASGTNIENALISRWVMADNEEAYYARLNDEALLPRIKSEIQENLRKRGGAESLLITADCKDSTMIGKTLLQVSDSLRLTPVEAALSIARNGGARVASFNMDENDLMNFMKQPWVMTSSDGTKGHPRKYASYPQKFYQYVKKKDVLSMEEFIHRSSGMVAQVFGITKRGLVRKNYMADIIVFDPILYAPSANFYHPYELTKGVKFLLVNGQLTINEGAYNGTMAGVVLKKTE